MFVSNEEYKPILLPYPNIDLETKNILKKTILTAGAIKELKGVARNTIPNQQILISFFALSEAKTSSEIENIHTTTEELIGLTNETENSKNIKEVLHYKDAIVEIFNTIKERSKNKKNNMFISENDIIDINTIIREHNESYRNNIDDENHKTFIGKKNKDGTYDVKHLPPQKLEDIKMYMSNLVEYINTKDEIDPLIKMAIIHYQFETIHPFTDGNGRTGRILNILYLILSNYLDFPCLYLSSYIVKNKNRYYELLQETRITQNFEPFILYMLDGVEKTANNTIKTIKNIKRDMDAVKRKLRKECSFYSKDLLECIFSKPYTTIEDVKRKINIKDKRTASKYLDKLVELKILSIDKKQGAESKYYNTHLITILKNSIK